MVIKMERGGLSTSLLALFVLFTVQFFLGMAQNLLVGVPMTTFPQNNSSFGDALVYVVTGGNWVLTSHFAVDIAIIAVGIANFAFTVHNQDFYKILSIAGLVSVLFAFANGLRFAASNFTMDDISYEMAIGFILGFILYFVMAMLMYRDMAIRVEES